MRDAHGANNVITPSAARMTKQGASGSGGTLTTETPEAVTMRDVAVSFPLPGGPAFRRNRHRLTAVDHVDLTLHRGQALGLVGESGCGKTTLGRVLVGETIPDSGEIVADGVVLGQRRTRDERRRVQMVFQDPMSSLNPRLRVGDVLAELLRVHDMVPRSDIERRCNELLSSVGLPERFRDVYPAMLSGGQRQRVSIARALALEPSVLVADEVTSALDVSIQAQVLALLLDLRARLGLTILFISHNLAVVRQVCERVAVMYLGRIVETGPTETVFADPQHPYTRLLLSSIPRLHGAPVTLADTPEASATRNAPGCRFAPRCPQAQPVCRTDDPALMGPDQEHTSACHFSFGRTVALDTPAAAGTEKGST